MHPVELIKTIESSNPSDLGTQVKADSYYVSLYGEISMEGTHPDILVEWLGLNTLYDFLIYFKTKWGAFRKSV